MRAASSKLHDPEMLHALLTGLINRMELGSSARREDDLVAGMHTAAALGDVERAKSLLLPPGSHAHPHPYIKRELNQDLPGNEVYCTACSLLVISKKV